MKDIYAKIGENRNAGEDTALCIVVNTRGSSPRKEGAKMLVYANGGIYGSIGGGELEKAVIENAKKVLRTKRPEMFRHDLLHQHSMCCGGTVDIYIEPIMKKNKLYIFGAGHTGKALAGFASAFDFEVVLIDDRKEYLDESDTKNTNKLQLSYSQALPLLPFDERTYVCIMTYSHAADRDILAYCMKKPHAYLGMIGSRRKTEVTKKMFAEAGIASADETAEVDMPMGWDIGAEDPEEIAISVLAKLIEVKNNLRT